ncbi:hypothetical protein NBG98_25285, partial [Burkholderia cenocepacia]|uniref:hypothetical protein n=1 Tax=Burkholderia cenocepacia TaxID=95486 RepID=UPI00203C0F86
MLSDACGIILSVSAVDRSSSQGNARLSFSFSRAPGLVASYAYGLSRRSIYVMISILIFMPPGRRALP